MQTEHSRIRCVPLFMYGIISLYYPFSLPYNFFFPPSAASLFPLCSCVLAIVEGLCQCLCYFVVFSLHILHMLLVVLLEGACNVTVSSYVFICTIVFSLSRVHALTRTRVWVYVIRVKTVACNKNMLDVYKIADDVVKSNRQSADNDDATLQR